MSNLNENDIESMSQSNKRSFFAPLRDADAVYKILITSFVVTALAGTYELHRRQVVFSNANQPVLVAKQTTPQPLPSQPKATTKSVSLQVSDPKQVASISVQR